MSKSANRKVLTNSCPFRAIFKMKLGYLRGMRDQWIRDNRDSQFGLTDGEADAAVKENCSEPYMPRTQEDLASMLTSIDWNKVFELHKLFNLHNHEMIDYRTLQTVKHPLQGNNSSKQESATKDEDSPPVKEDNEDEQSNGSGSAGGKMKSENDDNHDIESAANSATAVGGLTPGYINLMIAQF